MATETTPAKAAKAFTYVCPAGVAHVTVLREALNAGVKPSAILDAYQAARLPEFLTRKAYKGMEPAKVAKLVKKHGRTHLALAMGQLNPMSIAEQAEKIEKRIVNASATIERGKATLAALATGKTASAA
jgi:hypothetical protein